MNTLGGTGLRFFQLPKQLFFGVFVRIHYFGPIYALVFNPIRHQRGYAVELRKTICYLESSIDNPSRGLPEEVFLLISRLTPLLNVDLLIKNEQNHTFLTWRDDKFHPPGWHVPGGIIRYKEKIVDRVRAVAKSEFGAEVSCDQPPLVMHEIIHSDRKIRGHFISLLYRCCLESAPAEHLRCTGHPPKANEWMWHKSCPKDLISVHEIYRRFIES